MIKLLIDPRLLDPDSNVGSSEQAALDYWNQILRWSQDKRALLGVHSRDLLSERFAVFGYPDASVPVAIPALQGPCRAAINAIMARVLLVSGGVDNRSFHPRYLGDDEESLALQMDVSGSVVLKEVVGLASLPSSWETSSGTVTVSPPPPPELIICFDPLAELQIETRDALKKFFGLKRVFIVGGRSDPASMKKMADLGLTEEQIHWTPSEKHKPPRNLEEKWGGLDPRRDITVCITGRIGHAGSKKARDLAQRRGVPHLLGQYASDAVCALEEFALAKVLQSRGAA